MRFFLLSILSLICGAFSLKAQEPRDIRDTLQPLVIEEINKRIIDEYNDIIKYTNPRKGYNRFATSYSITIQDNSAEKSKSEGHTTFVSRNKFPNDFYYPLLPTNDSTATFWSAWNIYLAGWSMNFLQNNLKNIYKRANLSRKLLIHKETEGQITTYTLYIKELTFYKFDQMQNSVISVKFDTSQKKILEFSREAENGTFIGIKFEELKTTVKGIYSKKEFVPTKITTMVKGANKPVLYIENSDIEYGWVNKEEYKYLKTIKVF